MLNMPDIQQLSLNDLLAYTKGVINTCHASGSSAIILSSAFVSLKDKFNTFSHHIGQGSSVAIFEQQLYHERKKIHALKALEHCLHMHYYGNDEYRSQLATSFIAELKYVYTNSDIPLSQIQQSMLLSMLLKPSNEEKYSQLGINDLIKNIKQQEKEYQHICSESLNDLFTQNNLLTLNKYRSNLIGSLSNFFKFTAAMEYGNSDPSWNALSKKIDALNIQHP